MFEVVERYSTDKNTVILVLLWGRIVHREEFPKLNEKWKIDAAIGETQKAFAERLRNL